MAGQVIAPSVRVAELRGPQTSEAQDLPGVYAWYYVPDVSVELFEEKVLPVLESFVNEERRVKLSVSDLYRMQLVGSTTVCRDVLDGSRTLRDSLQVLLREPFVRERFLSREFVTAFCRPIYIGITSRSLRTRVYEEHYLALDDLWDERSAVTSFLARFDTAVPVDKVASDLGLKHTFALEARVRGIRPRDLLAQMLYLPQEIADRLEIDEGTPIRDLERLLHLISFPICGRV